MLWSYDRANKVTMTLQINSTTNQYITRTFSIEWQQKQTFALKLNSMGDRTQRGSPLKSAVEGAHVAHITAVPTENTIQTTLTKITVKWSLTLLHSRRHFGSFQEQNRDFEKVCVAVEIIELQPTDFTSEPTAPPGGYNPSLLIVLKQLWNLKLWSLNHRFSRFSNKQAKKICWFQLRSSEEAFWFSVFCIGENGILNIDKMKLCVSNQQISDSALGN